MSELTALQNLTKDFVHTYLAGQIAAVLRMANGYIYVRLDGIDPKMLEDKLKAVLGKEGELKTQISRGGLEVVFARK
jgi:hypothetical protein